MNREALTTRRKNGNEIKIIPRDHINKLLKNYILIVIICLRIKLVSQKTK